MKRQFSAPTVVNLELTEVCNVKCRHCYNYWRDESMGSTSLTTETFDRLLDQIIKAGIFHVVLTGGEPFAKFKLLEHGFRRLAENNISFSCNSNLMLATDERCRRLADLGLDHILTSLPSCDPATNDRIMGKVGSFEKIMEGMQNARRNGIRISVNMVVNKDNYRSVYETAKLTKEMDCQKLFVTRTVPPTYSHEQLDVDEMLTPEETRFALDEAVRARDELGIMVGTLVSYPLCFLSDLEKYKDFVGRGCPAQSGHVMSLNASGDAHACAHEATSYGNVFETPIQEIYNNPELKKWHQAYHYEGCAGCDYLDVCESGCRMTSLAVNGVHKGRDPLFVGPLAFEKHFRLVEDQDISASLDAGMTFVVPKRLRFRKEDGFYLLNVRWANTMPVETDVAEFLIKHQESGEPFTAADFGLERRDLLANLYFKDALEATDKRYDDERNMKGLSINLDALPTRRLRVAQSAGRLG